MAVEKLFRQEALDAANAPSTEGVPLYLPKWAPWVFWFVVVASIAAVGFSIVTPVWDYAEGRAVVQADDSLKVLAPVGGTAPEVFVRSGDRVEAGQLLVGFYTGAEQVELDRATREFELKLARVLQDPADQTARTALSTLRAERERAAARVRERSVFAPSAGIVSNLRVQTGQSFAPGDEVLTLIGEHAKPSYSVVAFVPGQYRPMIEAGATMRLELDGYEHAYTDVAVDAVGDQAVGPTEVHRYLGPEVGDELSLHGSLVMVSGHLTSTTFDFDHQRYPYEDGIPGRVSVRVRSERLVMMLFPYLREVFGYDQYHP